MVSSQDHNMFVAYLTGLLLFTHEAFSSKEPLNDPSPPRCAAEEFELHHIVPGTKILSIEAKEQHDYTSFGAGPLPALTGLNFCQVKVFLTHQLDATNSLDQRAFNDTVLVEVWLPLTHNEWNGRFQATGGAGFATGMFDAQLGAAIKGGYAAVSTDGGHDRSLEKVGDASWALNEDKSINWMLMRNFAIRSLVEQIAIGKSITEQYFGKAPHHSYWNGCSTGGRQGYAIAQRFPHLVDGILAEAPAISFTQLVVGEFWPQLRMALTNTYMSNCELEYYRYKTIEHCDLLDGAQDGMLEDPEDCDFNPYDLVRENHEFECDGSQTTFTAEMAELVSAIQRGPGSKEGASLFPGFAAGVPLDAVANTTVSEDGKRSQNPFRISASFLKSLVLKDPAFDLTSLDTPAYFELFGRASYEFGGLLNADNTDLSTLQASGTKLLTWHGLDDQMIPYLNTVNYRRKAEAMMGGAEELDKYYRLFLAPGVKHCGGGIGPIPIDPLAALVDWVEHENSPETLPAETTNSEGELVTRDLCLWPAKSKYMGVGDAKRASSWTCEGGTERLEVKGSPIRDSRAQQIVGDLADRLNGLGLGLSIS
jgi:hypothetical protein